MEGARPAFTLEAAKQGKKALPLEGWVAGAAGAGLLAGAALGVPDCVLGIQCPRPATAIAALLSTALLSGAIAWFALPVREDREALVRGVGALAVAASLLALLSMALDPGSAGPLLLAASAGAALPLAMLPVARPEATLEWGPRHKRRAGLWIRAGSFASAATAGGFALGFAFAWTNSASGSPLSPVGSVLVGAPLVGAGGTLVFLLSSIDSAGDSAEARPAAKRSRLLLRMTPMQRYDFLLECALVFAAAVVLTAVAVAGARLRDDLDASPAIVLGGGAGVLTYGLLAPAVDARFGRGRLLALAPASAAGAVLLVGAALPNANLFALFGASLLLAFAFSSAPQRYALAFDLAPSKGRLRAACDIHGAKLAVAATAPWVYLAIESVVPGTALVGASALCGLAVAVFAPTLGGLGRPQR